MTWFTPLTRSRLVLLAFGLAAVSLVSSPLVVRWVAMRDACPRATVSDGYFSDGMYWRITRAECGDDIGTVWQVHVSAADTQPRLAFDAQNNPVPLSVEQEQGGIVIRLDRPPQGSGEAWVRIAIVPKSRPKTVLHFVNGLVRGR